MEISQIPQQQQPEQPEQPQKADKNAKAKKNQPRSSQSLLSKLGKSSHQKGPDVIYGLYDAASQPMMTRLNDFLIDHSRVPLQEKSYFFQLLAVMVDAGIPVIQAVKMLARRTDSERFRRVLNTVAYTVTQGKTLSVSMARFPQVFSEVEIGVVRAGEASGHLDKMLGRLATQLSKSHELQTKLITASVYPAVVLLVLILAGSGMLIWVIPSLLQLLTEGGLSSENLPFATKLLVFLSFVMSNYWWAVLLGVAIIFLVIRYAISTENGKYKWDLFKLRIPVAGTLLRKVLILRFVSMLGLLIEAGLPVVQALTIVATSMDNEIYKLKVFEVIANVQQGQKISDSLTDTPFLFPETIVQMMAVGEQSASIGFISQKVGNQYDMEIDYSLKQVMSLLEPIMIVFVGATVALLALAILTPIFKLTQLV